jgi:hypothetical protein
VGPKEKSSVYKPDELDYLNNQMTEIDSIFDISVGILVEDCSKYVI